MGGDFVAMRGAQRVKKPPKERKNARGETSVKSNHRDS